MTKAILQKRSVLLTGMILVALVFYSCGRSISPTVPIFNWSLDGVSQPQADAVAYPNSIEAATPANHIEISLHTVNGFLVGVYTMDATGGNVIGFWGNSTPPIRSISGTLNISKSTTEKVSGTFDVMLADGSNLKGDFWDIEFN